VAGSGAPFGPGAAGADFAPTGAIVAAPITSLPEAFGGERNWDYRYTWVRDTSLTMGALWVAACPHDASKFFTFLADAAASDPGAAWRPRARTGVSTGRCALTS
jgi:alpha,alpha-trehalase